MRLSVVICAYNKADLLLNAIDSLKEQSCEKDLFELIVIDNNSTDNTKEVCLDFKSNNPDMKFSYYLEKKQGLSSARNRGIKESNYEIISFIDDDAKANKDYVKNLLDTFLQNPEYIAAGGKVLPVYPGNKEPEWLSRYLWGIVAKIDYGDSSGLFPKKYPAGCNMAFRKFIFEKFGGFNEELIYRGDEKYVFNKLKKGNYKVYYAANVVVYHYIDEKRIQHEAILKISRNIGESERISVRNGNNVLIIFKLFKYLFKLFAAFSISILFCLKGQYKKAKYLILVIWNTILGFINFR